MKHRCRIKGMSVFIVLLGVQLCPSFFLVGGLRYNEDLDYTYSYKLNSGVRVPNSRNFKYRDSRGSSSGSGSGNSFSNGGRNTSSPFATASSSHFPSYLNNNHRNHRDSSR
jgi:uncharacterized membrane protein YgcG